MSPDQIPQIDPAVGMGIAIGLSIFYLALYLYFVICMWKIGVKAGYPSGKAFWMSLIPIVNLFFILMVAEKPMWWIILLIVPFVNIIFTVIIWMSISERLGKPNWWGILMLVPIANFIIPGILAFGKEGAPATQAPA